MPKYGKSVPSIALKERAFAAVVEHPHYLAALANAYCVPTVKLISASLVEHGRWNGKTTALLKERLKDSDTMLLVSYITAPTHQDALSGSGTIYDFVLHPRTLEVLYTSKSFWIG